MAIATLNANPAFANFTLLYCRFTLTKKTDLGHEHSPPSILSYFLMKPLNFRVKVQA
jgi:hypothetical protein